MAWGGSKREVSMEDQEFAEKLEKRTRRFAVSMIRLLAFLPKWPIDLAVDS